MSEVCEGDLVMFRAVQSIVVVRPPVIVSSYSHLLQRGSDLGVILCVASEASGLKQI